MQENIKLIFKYVKLNKIFHLYIIFFIKIKGGQGPLELKEAPPLRMMKTGV